MLSLAKVSESGFDADAVDISEFNRFMLMGEWNTLIVVLLEECGAMDRFDKDNIMLVRTY